MSRLSRRITAALASVEIWRGTDRDAATFWPRSEELLAGGDADVKRREEYCADTLATRWR